MLKVKDSYLYEADKPFFYLGDTAWLLFNRLAESDIELYLKNRKSLGFNVIQAVLVYEVLQSTKEIRLSENYKDIISYFKMVKKYVNMASRMGIYFGLLPAWGSIVKEGIINSENVALFAKFLNDFFKDCDNIIWILGGDIRGDVAIDVFNTLGYKLKEYDPSRLITFHPFGRTASYLWFDDSKWLDFHMFQSGHRRYDQIKLGAWDDKNPNEDSFGEDNYRYIIKNQNFKTIKPILDGEPSYEGIVQGLHDSKEPYWEAKDIRRYAYWSVLEGACGFTYGNNAIMQFYDGLGSGKYGVRETWQEALHATGGAQMQYLKELFLKYDFTKGKPHPEYILNQKERHHRISCFAGQHYLICYTYKGDMFELSLKDYQGKKIAVFWQNPENNSQSYAGTVQGGKSICFRPIRRREIANDWLLILEVLQEGKNSEQF